MEDDRCMFDSHSSMQLCLLYDGQNMTTLVHASNMDWGPISWVWTGPIQPMSYLMTV